MPKHAQTSLNDAISFQPFWYYRLFMYYRCFDLLPKKVPSPETNWNLKYNYSSWLLLHSLPPFPFRTAAIKFAGFKHHRPRTMECSIQFYFEISTYKWNLSVQNYMSEDVHSSTFPRVTDICTNHVAPFLSRSRVFEKLKKWNWKSKNKAKV